MKYYKNIATGAVIKGENIVGILWRETTAREYDEYRARVARAMGNLEKAICYKKRLLKA